MSSIRHLKCQFEELTGAGTVLALTMGRSLKKSAVNAAIDEFEMRAICSRSTREVHVRVAADGDHLYIDLVDPDWHAVRVTAAGWSAASNLRVYASDARWECGHRLFPERGASIDALRPFLNINENDFVLVTAFLLAALQPYGPYPIFTLIGEQGASKTSLVRMLRSLVDPSSVPSGARGRSAVLIYTSRPTTRIFRHSKMSRSFPT